MWVRAVGFVLVGALAACGDGGGGPAAVGLSRVEVGAEPVALASFANVLLVGLRRVGQDVVPAMQRRDTGGTSEVGVRGVSAYGLVAKWTSIAFDGERVEAIGGQLGGAHGNTRWSVWTGSASSIVEQPQGFWTFGGYEMGDLVGIVRTPSGPAVIGSWQSASAGQDIAVWTPSGADWVRQNSAGTPLESTRDALSFPLGAANLGQGIMIAGWELTGGKQVPAVWRSATGATGWVNAKLPDAGQAGQALALRCWADTCVISGRVDGKLAAWRLTGDTWARLAGVPDIGVGDRDKLVAPVEVNGRLVQVVPDGGHVKIARADGDRWTVRDTTGPSGTVTAVTAVGDTIYVLAGPDEDGQALWKVDIGSLR
jgi:hypothetical protein